MGKYGPYDDDGPVAPRAVSSGGGKYGPNAPDDPAPAAAPPGAARTWGDTLGSWGQTADDAVRAAANAVTFGMADRLAGVTGGGTDAQVKLSEEARKRSPVASIAGDVGGAVLLPGIGGRQLAARYGGGWGARALGYGGEGAVLGAASGAGNTYTGKPLDYLTNAGMGGAIGGVLGAGMGGVFGPRGGMQSTAAVPTLPEQRAATNMAYDALRANPAAYDAAQFGGAGGQLRQRLLNEGYIPDYHPGTFRAVERMQETQAVPNAVVTPANIDLIRQGLNRIPKTELAAADREGARVVRGALDDFLVNPPAGAVLPGSQQAAAQAAHVADVARQSHAGTKRTELMARMRERADDVAARQNSGLNVENVIRQQVSNLLNPMSAAARGRLSGFNQEERQALRDIVHPGAVNNTLRTVGNMLGGGGGVATPVLSATLGTGGGFAGQYFKDDPATGAFLGAALPFVGMGMRGQSNRNARAAINRAEQLIAQRNPLYAQRAANAPMQAPAGAGVESARNIMTQALIQQGYGQTGFEDEPRLRLTVNPDYGTR